MHAERPAVHEGLDGAAVARRSEEDVRCAIAHDEMSIGRFPRYRN